MSSRYLQDREFNRLFKLLKMGKCRVLMCGVLSCADSVGL